MVNVDNGLTSNVRISELVVGIFLTQLDIIHLSSPLADLTNFFEEVHTRFRRSLPPITNPLVSKQGSTFSNTETDSLLVLQNQGLFLKY